MLTLDLRIFSKRDRDEYFQLFLFGFYINSSSSHHDSSYLTLLQSWTSRSFVNTINCWYFTLNISTPCKLHSKIIGRRFDIPRPVNIELSTTIRDEKYFSWSISNNHELIQSIVSPFHSGLHNIKGDGDLQYSESFDSHPNYFIHSLQR